MGHKQSKKNKNSEDAKQQKHLQQCCLDYENALSVDQRQQVVRVALNRIAFLIDTSTDVTRTSVVESMSEHSLPLLETRRESNDNASISTEEAIKEVLACVGTRLMNNRTVHAKAKAFLRDYSDKQVLPHCKDFQEVNEYFSDYAEPVSYQGKPDWEYLLKTYTRCNCSLDELVLTWRALNDYAKNCKEPVNQVTLLVRSKSAHCLQLAETAASEKNGDNLDKYLGYLGTLSEPNENLPTLWQNIYKMLDSVMPKTTHPKTSSAQQYFNFLIKFDKQSFDPNLMQDEKSQPKVREKHARRLNAYLMRCHALYDNAANCAIVDNKDKQEFKSQIRTELSKVNPAHFNDLYTLEAHFKWLSKQPWATKPYLTLWHQLTSNKPVDSKQAGTTTPLRDAQDELIMQLTLKQISTINTIKENRCGIKEKEQQYHHLIRDMQTLTFNIDAYYARAIAICERLCDQIQADLSKSIQDGTDQENQVKTLEKLQERCMHLLSYFSTKIEFKAPHNSIDFQPEIDDYQARLNELSNDIESILHELEYQQLSTVLKNTGLGIKL